MTQVAEVAVNRLSRKDSPRPVRLAKGSMSSSAPPRMMASADNDAYHALKAVDGLIVTGPTGTNVNDVAVALLG